MPDLGTIVAQVLSIPAVLAGVVIAVLLSAFSVHLISLALGPSHGAIAVYGFAAVCTFLSLWLVLGAVFAYINIGQAKKIETILGFYSPDTIADYFDEFWSGRDGLRSLSDQYRAAAGQPKAELGTRLEDKLKELFKTDFGLGVFIIPVILLVAAGGIVLFLGFTGGIGLAAALSSGAAPPVQPFGLKLDLISVAAIFGAYTWVASDVIVRNHQWTLHPSDPGWYTLRLIIAIPLGQALALTVSTANITAGSAAALATAASAAGSAAASVTLPTGAGAFAAFVVSMFSLDAITNALGTAATRFGVQMQSSPEERDDLVVKLAGVDEERARALKVEGITTIAQLVTIDPIRASIRTGLSFEYILNLIDAALLWTYVNGKLKRLAPLGLRGASDVLALAEAWKTPVTIALAALRQARTTLIAAQLACDQAQAAVTAAGANATPAQRQTLADAQASLAAAQTTLTRAATDYVTIATNILTPLRQAQGAVVAEQQTRDQALAAAAAAGAGAPEQQALAASQAALTAAQTALAAELTAYFAAVGPRAEPGTARADMLDALTSTTDDAPALKAVGFDTIATSLANDSYAVFIKRLLDA